MGTSEYSVDNGGSVDDFDSFGKRPRNRTIFLASVCNCGCAVVVGKDMLHCAGLPTIQHRKTIDMLRYKTLSATAGLLLLILSACSSTQDDPTASGITSTDAIQSDTPTQSIPRTKQEVIVCTTDEPTDLFSIGPDHYLWQTLGEPAVASDGDFGVLPRALIALPTPENGDLLGNQDGSLTVTLRYRDDLVWSDGQPFGANDALLGFATAQLPEIINVELIDQLTLQLTLTRDIGYPYVPNAQPLPSHVLGGLSASDIITSDYARLANPTLGPYFVQSWMPGQTISLVANPNYAGTAPSFSTLTVHFVPDTASLIANLQSGACDVTVEGEISPDDLSQLGQLDQIRTIVGPNLLWERINFNTSPDAERVPYFADARVRQAMAYAINRAALTDMLGSAAPLDSWLPPNHWAYPADDSTLARYPYDPQRAQTLLAEAGWRDTDGDDVLDYNSSGGEYSCLRGTWGIETGTPFSVTLLTSQGDELRAAIASQMQSDLSAIGVQLEILTLDPATLFGAEGPLTRRAFDMTLFASLTTPEPYGDNWWLGADLYRHPLTNVVSHDWQVEQRFDRPLVELLAATNIPAPANDYQGQNITGWCDEAANLAIYEASSALSRTQRQEAYARQQVLFSEQLPALPLFQRSNVVAHRPEICGLTPGPFAALTWNVTQWHFDPEGLCSS